MRVVVSGGFMRKRSASVGTAAYWIEIFEEQVSREAAKRRGAETPPEGPLPEPSAGEQPPKLS